MKINKKIDKKKKTSKTAIITTYEKNGMKRRNFVKKNKSNVFHQMPHYVRIQIQQKEFIRGNPAVS